MSPDYFMDDIKAIIKDALKKGAAKININPDQILLVLEEERSSSSKIREIFNNCGIHGIDTLSQNMRDMKSWINHLSAYNLECLHQEMEKVSN